MTYRTILVDLTADGPVEARLDVARSLASRFDAVLVGVHVVPKLFTPLPIWEGGGSVTSCPRLLKRNARSTRKPRSASAPPSTAPAAPTRQ